MHKNIDHVLVSAEQITDKAKELGRQITEEYKERKEVPLLVALLKGSVPFLSELAKHIELDIQIDFMDVSSYEGTESIGAPFEK